MIKLDELTITCCRRNSYTCYEGTREQLEAEGVVPEGIKWSDGFDTIEWEAGGLSFRMRRRRPEGGRGRKSDFVSCDNWVLFAEKPNADYVEYDIQQKEEELRRMRYAQTWEGKREASRHTQLFANARWDEKFRAFKALIPALAQGRKIAFKIAPITQGGDHA